MSSRPINGTAGVGRPCGNGPSTDTPAAPYAPETATTTVAATTATRMPGTRGKRLSSKITASVPPPIANVMTCVLPESAWRPISTICRPGPSAFTEKPSNFGS